MKIVILEIVIIWFLAYLILECWYNNYLRKENKFTFFIKNFLDLVTFISYNIYEIQKYFFKN